MKKRPILDDDIFLEVAKELSDDVFDWLGDKEICKDEVIKDLQEVLEDSFSDLDGYFLCSKLERCYHYSPDEELVEIMGRASLLCYEAKNKKIKEWVKENNILPQYKIGDIVEVEKQGKKYKGEIVDINVENATYSIYIEELGHIKEDSGKCGTLGIIKNFEEIL